MKKLFAIAAALALLLVAYLLAQRTNTRIATHTLSGFPVIEISGPLDPAGARKITAALLSAAKSAPPALIVAIDSPGGDLRGALDIADALAASPVPTIGYLREAVAATAYIVPAFDRIYFHPEAHCGSAEPVFAAGDPATESIQQKLAAYLRDKLSSHARSKGHDPAIFLALTNADFEFKRGETIVKPKGSLLLLDAAQALDLKLSSGTFADLESLATHLAHAPRQAP